LPVLLVPKQSWVICGADCPRKATQKSAKFLRNILV
jgi:hypothetical protein